jgi:hypothetical protein
LAGFTLTGVLTAVLGTGTGSGKSGKLQVVAAENFWGRVSGTLAASQAHASQEAADAIRTQGRSAVEKFSRQFRLPKTIVVSTHGVFPSS